MNSLTKIITKDIVLNKNLESVIKILLFSFLTFLGSLVRIYLPWTPIPVTLQTFFLFISVYYLNPKEIGISQSIYILAGIIGLPVFAAGISGMLALVGPTAGYLLGFIISGITMSVLKEKIKITPFTISFIFISGTIIVYLFGILHLFIIYKIDILTAIKIGVIPFIAGDILKIIVASMFCLKNKN